MGKLLERSFPIPLQELLTHGLLARLVSLCVFSFSLAPAGGWVPPPIRPTKVVFLEVVGFCYEKNAQMIGFFQIICAFQFFERG